MTNDFALFRTDVKASVRNDEDNTKPFEVSVCEFWENCGLYGIIGCESDKDMKDITCTFGKHRYRRNGGETSRGNGKFTLQTSKITDFFKKRLNKESNSCITWVYVMLNWKGKQYDKSFFGNDEITERNERTSQQLLNVRLSDKYAESGNGRVAA